MKILCPQLFFCFAMNCNVITKIEVNQKNTSEWTDMGIVVCNVSFGGIFLSRKWFWSNRNPILGAVSVFKKGHPTEPSVVLFCTVVQARRGSPLFSYSNPQLFSEDRTKTQKPISRNYLILNCWFWMWLTNVFKCTHEWEKNWASQSRKSHGGGQKKGNQMTCSWSFLNCWRFEGKAGE